MKPIAADDPQYRSDLLAEALEKQDVAAIAYALRNDKVIVPLLPVEGPAQVRVFRRGEADKYMLLLFSSAAEYVRMLPQESNHSVVGYTKAELLDFLKQNEGVLELVWFDVASPHAMQATPRDIIEALELEEPQD